MASQGVCQNCGVELKTGWHGDHIKAHSRGGETELHNGQALCPKCNLKKGNKEIEPTKIEKVEQV